MPAPETRTSSHRGPHRLAVALAFPLLAMSAPHRALAAEQPSAEAEAQIKLVGEVHLSDRLTELTLQTADVAAKQLGPLPGNPLGLTKVRVLLPRNYDASAKQRYPVLYLYHGGTENFAAWTSPASKGKAEELTAEYPLIVVMPDGGMAGGYADWYNGGGFGPPKWMTYHLDKLIPWIDAHYRTIARRGGRATAGLSMGGGGFRYAAQRPDLIGATASFSGDIDILQPASDWNGIGAPISKLIWGDRKTQELRWRGVNGPDLAKNLSNTDIAIYAGDTARPESTYILPGAKAVSDRLKSFGIEHSFTLHEGMSHTWPNWNRALKDWLPRLMGRFHAFSPSETVQSAWPAPAGKLEAEPATFSFSSIQPSYTVYGWDVRLQRRAAEFSALEVTDRGAFAVIGSGKAIITTPALARPGEKVRLGLSGCGGEQTTLAAKADRQGRLTLTVPLGPANPFQQYSPEANAAANSAAAQDTPFPTFNNGSKFCRASVRVTRSRGR